MHLLVTGAAGFIGSDFVRHWVGAHPGDTVIALDLLTYAGTRESLAEVADRIEFVEGDIGDLDLVAALLARHEIDVVVNFAAESHNSLSVLDPERFVRTNVLGTQTLLEAARRHGVRRFHHVSTDEVFGDLALDDPGAFAEDTPYRPRTIYAASKAGADHVVRAYHETFGLPVTISNCANNYGPYQFPEKVLPVFTTRALDDEPLPMYASTQNRREWLHVRDHNRAIDRILLDGRDGRDLHDRQRARGEHRGDRRPRARRARQATVAQADRAGPSRSRPAVRGRRDEDPARARVGARGRVRARHPLHGRVVRREPCVVGTAPRPRAGGRDRVGREHHAEPVGARMRVLVTGGAGQVGALIAEQLPGHDVLTIGRADLDIADRDQVEQVVSTFAPHAIVNAAAMTDVDGCERDPERAFAVNALAVRWLAIAAARVDAHIVHISTDYVFDGAQRHPYDEWDAVHPLSEYGRSKLAGEREVAEHAGSWAVVRTSWVFGKRGSDLISWAFGAYDRDELDGVLADQVSVPTYAPDLAALLAEFAVERRRGLYHLTSGSEAGDAPRADLRRAARTRARRRRASRRSPPPTSSVPRGDRSSARSTTGRCAWRVSPPCDRGATRSPSTSRTGDVAATRAGGTR